MTASPAVSVCVPTFNRVAYLGECLRAILRQTFADFELLVLDNASTDGTPRFVEALRDPRVRYHRQPHNLGQPSNINAGLALARGEFVCICHDDDCYAPHLLQREVDALRRAPGAVMVHAAVRLISADGVSRGVHRVARRDYVRPGRHAFLDYLARGHDVVFSTVMARRSAYEAAGPFAADYLCADFDMWLRLALMGDIAYLAEPLADYRIHAHSASRRMTAARWFREYFEIFDRAAALGAVRLPDLASRLPSLRARAARHQAQRSRIEAMACLAAADAAAARSYLGEAQRLDSSWVGRGFTRLLEGLCNPAGGAMLRAVRGARQRVNRWRAQSLTAAGARSG